MVSTSGVTKYGKDTFSRRFGLDFGGGWGSMSVLLDDAVLSWPCKDWHERERESVDRESSEWLNSRRLSVLKLVRTCGVSEAEVRFSDRLAESFVDTLQRLSPRRAAVASLVLRSLERTPGVAPIVEVDAPSAPAGSASVARVVLGERMGEPFVDAVVRNENMRFHAILYMLLLG